MKKIILINLILVLLIAGCTNHNSEKDFIHPQNTAEIPSNNPPISNQQINNKPISPQQENSFVPQKIFNLFDTLPSCKDRMDFLNFPPLKYSDFINIIPLGNFNPPGHTFPTDHIYLSIKRENENGIDTGTANVPLYIPGDGWITDITISKHLSENPPFDDYDLTFHPCKELSFRFGHITSLSDELLAKFNEGTNCDEEYNTGGQKFQRCSNRHLNLKVSSGQQIGTAGGNPNQNALDIWATDTRIPELKFANSNLVNQNQNLKYTACPLNYFIATEKEKLYSLLGGFDNNKRTIEPRCGTIEQDIKDTAQGIWFAKNTKTMYPEDPHLALAIDNVNPQLNVFSVGTTIPNLKPQKYTFNPESTGEVNIAFSQVKPGTIYCYEQSDFKIILELLNENNLKIEKQSGHCNPPFQFIYGVLFER